MSGSFHHGSACRPLDGEGLRIGLASRTIGLRLPLLLLVAGLLSCDWITSLGNDPPTAVGTIPDQVVEVDSVVPLDLAPHFDDPDGDSLAYTAVSAAPLTAASHVSGSMLAVAGVAKGETRVTVTAHDPDGLTATQSFAVTVPNRAPVVADTIPAGEVYVDSALVIDAGAYFVDPDGDDLAYAATSSDSTRAAVAVSGSVVTVTGMGVGGTTVTVTARDVGGLEVEQSFAVTVPNRTPVAVGTIEDRVVEVDSVAALDVAPYFADPDRDSLAYAAGLSDSARVGVVWSGSTLRLTGMAKGSVRVTVTARDPWGLEVGQGFAVRVPNRTPVAVGTIGARELYVGDALEIDVAAHFADPDGDVLAYAAASSDTTRARVAVVGGSVTVTGVGVGDTRVTVTAGDPEGLSAEQTFEVTVPNRAPVVVGTIEDRDVYVDDTVAVDVAAYFTEPDGEMLAYAAASSSDGTATVEVSGSVVAVVGGAVGEVVVTVTARDPHGEWAEQQFAVTVPNRAPVRVGAIEDRVVEVDSVFALDVVPYFADPDRDALAYAANSSDSMRVGVVVVGSMLTVTGVAKGSVTVTVTARDRWGLEAEQGFAVRVPNRAPSPVGTIGARELHVGDALEIDVAAHFTDPDGDALAYAAASADSTRAVVVAVGRVVTVTGVAVGNTMVTVTASDPEGLMAEQAFEVTLPNRGPEPVGTIEDRDVHVGDTVLVDVAAYFAEPDGEALEYVAVSSSNATVMAEVSGSMVTVEGRAVGEAVVTVTARDPHGEWAEQQFAVTVPSRAPVPVGAIADRVVEVDSVAEVDVAAHFTEPDGEALAYAATSADTTRVTVAMSGSTLTLTGVAKGDVTVTVTARDPGGLEAEQRFEVTVPNRAPTAVGTIVPRVVDAGSTVTVDVAAHFTDPDGDALRYAAVSSDPGRATVSVMGSVVTVTGVAGGNATVTVTATDSAGLTAIQGFSVTVPNQAPGAVGTIPDRAVEPGRSVSVDVAPFFSDPDGDRLTYSATSSNTRRATVAVSGSRVTTRGERPGIVTITVTATDPADLSATQSFRVRVVRGNSTPESVGTMPDREVATGNTVSENVSSYFEDPDGDDLDYAASSSNPDVATVALAGATLTVAGVAEGDATITVTATDPGGLAATQGFDVSVGPAPPSDLIVHPPSANPNVLGPGESFTLRAVVENRGGGSASSGTTLRYYRSSNATIGTDDTQIGTDAVARLRPSQNSAESLSVTAPFALGTYYYGACADAVDNESDAGNNCSSSVEVVVTQSNRAPRAIGTIPDRTMEPGDAESIDAATYFTDPDGDDLVYAAASNNTGVATVTRSGSTVTVTAVGAGDATITVTATDPGGLTATHRFEVTVQATPESDLVVRSPVASPDALGPGESFSLSAIVDNRGAGAASTSTTLRYYRSSDATISTGDTQIGTDAVARLGPSQSSAESLPVTAPSGEGTYYYGACVDAVANESDTGNNCSSAVEVEVKKGNQAPRTVGTIPDRTVTLDDEIPVDAEPYFTDPDGDDLDYTAASSDTDIATVRVSGSDVRAKGQDEGVATITVTATDPGGLFARQSFELTVEDLPNQAPVVVRPIVDLVANPGDRYGASLIRVFTDPDGDDLAWSTSSANTGVAESEISGDSIFVDAVAVGSTMVTVTATDPDGLFATDTFTVEVVDLPTAQFDIDLYFTDDVTDAHRATIARARDSWESVLAATELNDAIILPPVECLGLGSFSLVTVDDHAFFVDVDSIDGPGGTLAYAGYCYERPSDGTPVLSSVIIDEDDVDRLSARGSLAMVVFHEFAHGLGFDGSYWADKGLVNTGSDPHFTGTLAIAAFNAAGGTSYTGSKVPISSPDYSHWRESVFDSEGMTAELTVGGTNPFSAITLQAMADIGYVVDLSLAEDYQLPSAPPPDLAADEPGEVFDLSNDVIRGPVVVIDTEGQVVRVIPPPPGTVLPAFRRKEVRLDRRAGDVPGTWTRSPARRDPPGR